MSVFGVRLAAVVVGAGLAVAAVAEAGAVVLLQTGFEAPTYSLGTLQGQDGWFNNPVGVVQTGVVASGTQAVAFNSTGLSGQHAVFRAVPHIPTSPHDGVVRASIQMFYETVQTNTLWTPMAIFGAGFAWLGQIIVFNGIASHEAGSLPVSPGVWNTYEMVVDFNADVLTTYVNGTMLGSNTFSPSVTGFGFLGFGINSTSNGTSRAYFDNLSITATPEPVTLAVLGAGLLGLAAVRRRRAG
jgi:hypothetical protein